MSELTNISMSSGEFHQALLAGVSALALLGAVYVPEAAKADEDADRPIVWIELGGQLERLNDTQVPFTPPFFDAVTKAKFESPIIAGRPAIYSNGIEGTVSFQPDNSDWVFSGSVRYGRSVGHRFVHQQTPGLVSRFALGSNQKYRTAPPNYAQIKAQNSESHFTVDFRAGKEIGVGMFGNGGISTFGLGVTARAVLNGDRNRGAPSIILH